jgi:antitoxin CptB
MINNENLKKKIIYRSKHRGTKEMDLILGSFVMKYIDDLNESDLNNLEHLLLIEDEILYQFYFNKDYESIIPLNKITKLFKNFKI